MDWQRAKVQETSEEVSSTRKYMSPLLACLHPPQNPKTQPQADGTSGTQACALVHAMSAQTALVLSAFFTRSHNVLLCPLQGCFQGDLHLLC